MSKVRKPSLTIPTPQAYARAAVRAIGKGITMRSD